MSSLPGLTLEEYLAWLYDVVLDGKTQVNPSLTLAESLGTSRIVRPRLTTDEFHPVTAIFEPYRDHVEFMLASFDESTSWRDYSGYAFDVPDAVCAEGQRLKNKIMEARNNAAS